MLKLLFILGLLYVSYRLFIPKNPGIGNSEKQDLEEPEEYTDYEEIE